jgi:hypothetical protein
LLLAKFFAGSSDSEAQLEANLLNVGGFENFRSPQIRKLAGAV